MTGRIAIALDALADEGDRHGIRHAFFTRQGGVSDGIYGSLNCGFGSGDDVAKVEQNRAIAAATLHVAADRLVSCYQIHGTTALTVEQPWHRTENPQADAMVTTVPGIALGVLAADCAPVLFADPQARVIGAAHGGWRGALSGVMEATVAAMTMLGARADHILAGIGPCIAQPSYEVDDTFRARFLDADDDNSRFFVPGPAGKPHFDLEAYVVHRLIAAGIDEVEALNLDTYAEPDRFFSFRRATHRGEADYGRQLSAIAISG